MPYLQNSLGFLLETIAGLYFIAVILRFLFQLLRLDFRNPLVQTVVLITNPPLRFLRRFVPGLYGFDFAAVILIWLIATAKLVLQFFIAGHSFSWTGALIYSLADSIDQILWVFLFAVLARVVVSWVAPHSHHPAIHIVNGLSQPVMAPFRRILPSFGGLDFSPIVSMLALRLVQQLVVSPLAELGAHLL